MARKNVLAMRSVFSLLCFLACTRLALGITVGGWSLSRGSEAAILVGSDFAGVRDDLAKFFPAVTVTATPELTTAYLNSVDVLLIDPVFFGNSVQIDPLNASEQEAFKSFVNAGGRALVLGENLNYSPASDSMIGPFGPDWGHFQANGLIDGTITDHASFPAITDGPFGTVNTYQGGYVGWFANVGRATPLGNWNIGGVSLAALNYGSGTVVVFGDNGLLYNLVPDNQLLRRNTLAYLLGVAPTIDADYNNDGFVDTADYTVWRDTLGQIGSGLAADGDRSGTIDEPDYKMWRANFGATAGSGAAQAFRSIPEPTTCLLLMFSALALIGRPLRRD